MTAHVRIIFSAMFKSRVGQREILQEVNSNTTVRTILDTLAGRYGGEFNSIIDPETGQVSLDTFVMLNGKSVREPDVSLRDSDVVLITVPVGGG